MAIYREARAVPSECATQYRNGLPRSVVTSNYISCLVYHYICSISTYAEGQSMSFIDNGEFAEKQDEHAEDRGT